MSDIASLGYVRVRSTDMENWRTFAFETIGFAEGVAPRGVEGELHIRIDERPSRLVVVSGDEDRVDQVGWEARDHGALARLRARVVGAGIEVTDMDDATRASRRVEAGFSFTAPGNTPVEIFHGMRLDHSPLNTPYNNRFVTGRLGLGHVVVPVDAPDEALDFYADVLDFRSRGAFAFPARPGDPELRIRFMGVNARHHSLAIMPSPSLRAPALVHVMVECETLDEVGRALDRVLKAGWHLSSTLGRHTNDKMISFYVRTPGGWDLEVGCEGLLVDDATYTAEEITADSYWGHQWDFTR